MTVTGPSFTRATAHVGAEPAGGHLSPERP